VSETDIGWGGLAASLVLIALAVGLSAWQRLRLGGQIVWATGRSAAQMFLVGWALKLVLDPDAPLVWAWLWVAAMVVFAGFTVRSRSREVPGALLVGTLAMLAVATVSLGVILGFGIFPVEGRTIVPLAGMMIGNPMTATVVCGRRIVAGLSDNRDEVEARLALGHSWSDASRPYVREAMRTALIPQIENTKALGLVFLPGAMTGLLLAGVDAADAVAVQLAIMYLILGSVAVSVTVVGLGLTRQMFTPDHRLRRVARRAG
jgi:putative ABC transport system permease protein